MASNRDEPLSFLNASSPVTVSDGDSYLIDTIGSAPGSFQNDGFLSDPVILDAEFGFTRPEFRTESLAGTVDLYQRHVFLCYKSPQVWPPRIEAAEFDRLPRLLSAAVSARKADMRKETRLTICEGRDASESSNGDVLIFPDMVRYRRLTHFDVDTFVEEVLVKESEWLPGTPEKLTGTYVFVCSHGTRDRRCGVCGPVLITRFKEEIESCGLQGKVFVRPCSHIGGHKYAGNVIIFGSSISGEVTGHWYGYVSPEDVPILLEQHILKGEIVDWLWRGQMGIPEEQQLMSQEVRLQRSEGPKAGRSKEEYTRAEPKEPESVVCGTNANFSGCCQQDGSPCCQNPILPGGAEIPSLQTPEEVNITAEKKIGGKKGFGRNNSSTRRIRTAPSWTENWELEDTYAALAVVWAAASIFIAYNAYKKLK
ncbi:unnamed protein product [Rhodiola kirilowii]